MPADGGAYIGLALHPEAVDLRRSLPLGVDLRAAIHLCSLTQDALCGAAALR